MYIAERDGQMSVPQVTDKVYDLKHSWQVEQEGKSIKPPSERDGGTHFAERMCSGMEPT